MFPVKHMEKNKEEQRKKQKNSDAGMKTKKAGKKPAAAENNKETGEIDHEQRKKAGKNQTSPA